jgi:hypothetical protein
VEMLSLWPRGQRTRPSSTACSSTSCPESRHWVQTCSPPTTASRLMTWWRRWPLSLSRSKKERSPQGGVAPQSQQRGGGSGQRGSWRARRSPDAVAGYGRCPTLSLTRSRPGWRQGCASTTSATGPTLGRAAPPAPGRETSWPGVAQSHHRRAADPHAGPDHQQAFPCGHRCFLQHHSTLFFSTCHRSEAHTLLGRPPGAASIPGSGFFLEISISRCSFPHFFGVDFLRFHKLLIDPEGHALLDNTGRRFASQVRPSLLMATVVIRFVQQYVLAWPTPPDQS